MPYDVYDAHGTISSAAATLSFFLCALSDHARKRRAGKYNGVILTDTSALELVAPGSYNGAYERNGEAR